MGSNANFLVLCDICVLPRSPCCTFTRMLLCSVTDCMNVMQVEQWGSRACRRMVFLVWKQSYWNHWALENIKQNTVRMTEYFGLHRQQNIFWFSSGDNISCQSIRTIFSSSWNQNDHIMGNVAAKKLFMRFFTLMQSSSEFVYEFLTMKIF